MLFLFASWKLHQCKELYLYYYFPATQKLKSVHNLFFLNHLVLHSKRNKASVLKVWDNSSFGYSVLNQLISILHTIFSDNTDILQQSHSPKGIKTGHYFYPLWVFTFFESMHTVCLSVPFFELFPQALLSIIK